MLYGLYGVYRIYIIRSSRRGIVPSPSKRANAADHGLNIQDVALRIMAAEY